MTFLFREDFLMCDVQTINPRRHHFNRFAPDTVICRRKETMRVSSVKSF